MQFYKMPLEHYKNYNKKHCISEEIQIVLFQETVEHKYILQKQVMITIFNCQLVVRFLFRL